MHRRPTRRAGGARLLAWCGLLAVLAASVAACAGPSGAGPSGAGSAQQPADLDGAWTLTGGTTSTGLLQPPPGAPVTLVVDGDEVSGRSACNHYGTTLDRDGDRVRLRNVGGTEMGCEPDVMEVERRYVEALMAVDTARRAGETLTLTGPDVRLAFVLERPVPTVEVVGTTWVVESLLDGETASSTVSSVVGKAYLRLGDDQSLEGHTGCRPFHGRYTLQGTEVHVTELDATRGAARCAGEVTRQDAHVLAVLESFRAEVDGEVLVLTAPGGRGLQLRARP